jgi:hypothetical protein
MMMMENDGICATSAMFYIELGSKVLMARSPSSRNMVRSLTSDRVFSAIYSVVESACSSYPGLPYRLPYCEGTATHRFFVDFVSQWSVSR